MISYCAMHFIVGNWARPFSPKVWNGFVLIHRWVLTGRLMLNTHIVICWQETWLSRVDKFGTDSSRPSFSKWNPYIYFGRLHQSHFQYCSLQY